MPPTPQPSTPSPLIIVVCESVPTSVSGNAWPSRACDHVREVLEVDLVADAGVRRHHGEVVERRLAPAQERVALAVALELQLGVALERAPLAEHVDLDRVVDHQLDRHQRVDLRRVAAQLLHRVAHRRQVDDRRHAGEVLHQHAAGRERDLDRRAVGSQPRERLDVLARHRLAVLGAQQVLEQHLQRERQPRDVEAACSASSRKISYDSPPTSQRGTGHVLKTLLACTIWPASSTCTRPTRTARARSRRSRGRRGARADVVLLTDHDTLAAKRNGEEGWYGDVLLLVGEEVSPRAAQPLPGLRRSTRRSTTRASTPPGSARRCADAGGFGFAAHPFSRGLRALQARGPGCRSMTSTPTRSTAIELWSFVNDTGEALASVPELLRFVARPGRALDHPPGAQHRAWDELCRAPPGGGHRRHRRAPVRQADRAVRAAAADGLPPLVPATSAHTCSARAGERRAEHDREQVYAALREGRCYIAVDSIAPGARVLASRPTTCRWAPRRPPGGGLGVRTPGDGAAAAGPRRQGDRHRRGPLARRQVEEPGVYRVEALKRSKGGSAPGSSPTRSTCAALCSRESGDCGPTVQSQRPETRPRGGRRRG